MRIAFLIESHASDSTLSHTDGDVCSAGAGPGLQNRGCDDATPNPSKRLRKPPSALAAHRQRAASNDPDLAAVIDAWDRLPEAVRAGIVAMVRAAGGGR
jgi:hypothetical protein